jgi:BirA family transcriptional regulator, biotin operon repressor / biotin---[acetyl-CoA-carboxylase] ligase
MGIDMPRAPLDQSQIAATLSHYWRVSVVDLTTSTQSDLAEKINAGDAHSGDVIVADFQSAGRGRLDRTFSAPVSTALLFSLYLTPQRSRTEWGFLPLLAGISVAETLNTVNAGISIKWPNDLLINEKKVGGIISTIHGDGVIIGVGINISMSVQELPVENATSLGLAGVVLLDRNLLLSKILNSFETDFMRWDLGESFMDRYLDLSATIMRNVRIELPGGREILAKAISIDEQGQLNLDDGQIVSVGDVIHLR